MLVLLQRYEWEIRMYQQNRFCQLGPKKKKQNRNETFQSKFIVAVLMTDQATAKKNLEFYSELFVVFRVIFLFVCTELFT